MAYLGFKDDLDFSALPAGTYWIIKETGEVYDSEMDLENYNWAWYPHDGGDILLDTDEIDDADYDERTDGEWIQEPFDVERIEVEPIYITLQNNPYAYDDFVWSYNVNRGLDNIPPDWVGREERADTFEEGVELAHDLAKERSRETGEAVGVTSDREGFYGDVLAVYENGKET